MVILLIELQVPTHWIQPCFMDMGCQRIYTDVDQMVSTLF